MGKRGWKAPRPPWEAAGAFERLKLSGKQTRSVIFQKDSSGQHEFIVLCGRAPQGPAGAMPAPVCP